MEKDVVAVQETPMDLAAEMMDSQDQDASGEKNDRALFEAILNRQIETPQHSYPPWQMYRYASRRDLLIMAVSVVASCASGACMPCMTLVFGGMQGAFQDFLVLGTMSRDEFQSTINSYALYFVYLGIGSLVTSYVSTVGFLHTGENIATNLRQQYLESCLRQNMAYFDNTSAAEVASRITTDANKVQDGISEKVGTMTSAVAALVASFIIGFTVAWKLTFVMSATFFSMLLGITALSYALPRFIQPLTMTIIQSSTLAHEIFSNVRVVMAFGGQEHFTRRFDGHLGASQTVGFKIKACVALLTAFFMGMSPLTYSLGFWQGSLFLVKGEIDIQAMITVIMATLIGSYHVGFIGPNVQAFNTAVATASNLMTLIDRKPTADATDEAAGQRLTELRGAVTLAGVTHIFPSRPDVTVLDRLSVSFGAGETTALVGASGSGKSTIFGLLQRFYEPVQGAISLDGRDISELNLGWLRRQIGVVGQEPVLFTGSVFDNIKNGLVGSEYEDAEEHVQRDMVIQAAKTAHAHDFIMTQLVDGYETDVGQRALLLSGGQRQRIAIARAIVSNPKILLLDEATSALDPKSEAAVQLALDQASFGRTTITIAHRLSTVRKAHKILVLDKGQLLEKGSHQELLDKRGAYYHLVATQELLPSTEDDLGTRNNMDVSDVSSSRASTTAQDNKSNLDSSDATPQESTEVARVHEQLSLGDENMYTFWETVCFIFALNKEETKSMVLASLFCILAGIAAPIQSILFAKQLTTLSHAASPHHDKWQVRHDSNFWSLMLLASAIVIFFAYLVQGLIFAHAAEALTRRAKRQTMAHLLRQDVGFFDLSQHGPSALGAFLSLQTAQLASMSGANLGNLVTSVSTIIGGAALALGVGWKLALVCLSVVPFLVGCNIAKFFIQKEYEGRAARVFVQSAAYASEYIVAVKTVASLGLERHVAATYRAAMDTQRRQSLVSFAKSGFLLAVSQSSVLLCLGLAFWYGSSLMVKGEYGIFQFYVCVMSIIFGTNAAGAMLAFVPDLVKARHAAAKLKTVFTSKASIDTQAPGTSSSSSPEPLKGHVELRDVNFVYPSRPDKPVLRGINLAVKPSQHVALVGLSGCGKSTILGLLERFYDPDSGTVLLDGKDISSIPISDYRSHLALVSQEPTLFQGTIMENIQVGTRGETEVGAEAIETACRDAGIWDFVLSLPEGLDTDVGSAGSLLSGGQKQRIAIARALIRLPKVLLLDEATSALDSESERVVQEALARAAKGRTTVTVAHRLATVMDADLIFVIEQGKVTESGSHEELLARGGLYAELAKLQSLAS